MNSPCQSCTPCTGVSKVVTLQAAYACYLPHNNHTLDAMVVLVTTRVLLHDRHHLFAMLANQLQMSDCASRLLTGSASCPFESHNNNDTTEDAQECSASTAARCSSQHPQFSSTCYGQASRGSSICNRQQQRYAETKQAFQPPCDCSAERPQRIGRANFEIQLTLC